MPNFHQWTAWTKLKVWGILGAMLAVPLVASNVMLRMPGKSYTGALPPLSTPETSARDDLRDDLHHLAATIGERNVGHPESLALARDWIEARFRSLGYETKLQTYDADGIACSNVVAELRGGAHHDEIVLVGAHYDSAQGTAGANDNGSGLVALLELARRFARRAPDRAVRFVAFVNEEQPYSSRSIPSRSVFSIPSRATSSPSSATSIRANWCEGQSVSSGKRPAFPPKEPRFPNARRESAGRTTHPFGRRVTPHSW